MNANSLIYLNSDDFFKVNAIVSNVIIMLSKSSYVYVLRSNDFEHRWVDLQTWYQYNIKVFPTVTLINAPTDQLRSKIENRHLSMWIGQFDYFINFPQPQAKKIKELVKEVRFFSLDEFTEIDGLLL